MLFVLGYKRLSSLEAVIKDDRKCEREKKRRLRWSRERHGFQWLRVTKLDLKKTNIYLPFQNTIYLFYREFSPRYCPLRPVFNQDINRWSQLRGK